MKKLREIFSKKKKIVIELIKETDPEGKIFYWVAINKDKKIGSCSMDKAKTEKWYQAFIKSNGEDPIKVSLIKSTLL